LISILAINQAKLEIRNQKSEVRSLPDQQSEVVKLRLLSAANEPISMNLNN